MITAANEISTVELEGKLGREEEAALEAQDSWSRQTLLLGQEE